MFFAPCRHCSEEHSIHPHTTLEKDLRTGMFKPGKNGKTLKSLGFFCNDAGKFVDVMHYCPVKWVLTSQSEGIVKRRIIKKIRKKLKRKRNF